MADFNPIVWWKKLLGLPNDSLTKTLAVAFLVVFTASVLVSVTAVSLRPFHLANLDKERQAQFSAMVAALPGMEDILSGAGVDNMEIRIVDLATGDFSSDIDAASYDQREAATDPALSTQIPSDLDLAQLKQRANFAQIFVLRKDSKIELVVLPVRGLGFQSMLYAYLALWADGNTVAGLIFYEQGETPGIGTRIEEPDWLALWPGKQIADEDGTVKIAVVRGQATSELEVDGISGATRTGNGVTNMLQFWLGDLGFGPFLTRLRTGEI